MNCNFPFERDLSNANYLLAYLRGVFANIDAWPAHMLHSWLQLTEDVPIADGINQYRGHQIGANPDGSDD